MSNPVTRHFTLVRRTFVAGLLTALQLSFIGPASADQPTAYGWWAQTNVGAPGTTSPTDVPTDGLYVQNLPGGPTAISALQFTLPEGGAVGALTLRITGTPVITAPPIACLATPPFKPVKGGAWTDRPSYNCGKPVQGLVDANQTRVQFPAAALATGSRLVVVLLAGGTADRIAFAKPGIEALALSSPAAPSTDAGTFAGQPLGPTQQPAASSSGPVATAPIGASGAPAMTDAQPPSPPLLAVPPADVPAVQASQFGVASVSPIRRTVGTVLGLGLFLIVLVYWSDGFGALRLRTALVTRLAPVRPGGPVQAPAGPTTPGTAG